MAYMVLRVPSEYALELTKGHHLWRELFKCNGEN